MGTVLGLRIVALLVAGVCSVSCNPFSFMEPWDYIPKSEYFLRGNSQLIPNQVSEVDTELLESLNTEFGSVELKMGLFKRGGQSSSETYRIKDGMVGGGQYPKNGSIEGTYSTQGETLHIDLTKHPQDGVSIPITLIGVCNHTDAQSAITEVRTPKWGNNTSMTDVEINWTISGLHNGESYSFDFTQIFVGISISWNDPV